MRKKLLFVITKSEWGGAGRYVFDLATAFSKTYEVAVALGGEGPLATCLQGARIRTIALPSLGRAIRAARDSAAFFELLALFRAERPDIVHLNSSKAGGLGALAARLAGVPHIVFTVHGWAYNEPVPALSRLFRWLASLATVLLSHRVIAVSEFDRVHAPLSLETTAIHNGIESPQFLSAADAHAELARRSGGAKNAVFVGTIAELTKNKGVDVLIEAFAKTSGAELVVIGEGEDRPLLEALIAKRGLGGRTHLLGFIENAAELLRGFDVFALASRKEGLPYVLLEAGAAGVPVVATTVGGIPEIVDDGLSGILTPAYDVPALACALNELIESPGARRHYAERLLEKVARYFSLRGMVKKTAEVYEG